MLSGLPKKSLKVAHLNICSLRNKVNDVQDFIVLNSVHILAISETHLDHTFSDSFVAIPGFNVYRRDRNCFGGGVAFYVQDQIPVKVREDIMPVEVEVLWLQVHLPQQKDMLVGCCYRPPNAHISYMDNISNMLDKVCDLNVEVILTGDLNVDWLSSKCSLKLRLTNIANMCGLKNR